MCVQAFAHHLRLPLLPSSRCCQQQAPRTDPLHRLVNAAMLGFVPEDPMGVHFLAQRTLSVW